MYLPKLYRQEDQSEILQFMRRNNFPVIISQNGGKLLATHLPVEIVEGENGAVRILAHMSRANPQWKSFGEQEALMIFQGPHTYISARWYNHLNVPTWNYMMIHAYGTIKTVEGEDLRALLSQLVHIHEPETGYTLENLPEDFVRREMKGVAGFEMQVTRIEAGYKLSQNRNAEDHAQVVRELELRGDENSARVAEAMRENRKLR